MGAHEHPSLTSPSYAEPGNGLLLFFRVDNFDVAVPRARALISRLDEEPNPSTGTAEFSLRDPDAYYVTNQSRSTRPNPSIEPTAKRSRMAGRVRFAPDTAAAAPAIQSAGFSRSLSPMSWVSRCGGPPPMPVREPDIWRKVDLSENVRDGSP